MTNTQTQDKNRPSNVVFRPSDSIAGFQQCLNDLSKRTFDATTTATDHPKERFELYLSHINLTNQTLPWLLRILNYPFPQPSTTTTITTRKWDQVRFDFCKFQRPGSVWNHIHITDDKFCSVDEEHLLGATLARQTSSLTLGYSPEILACLVGSAANLEMDEFLLNYDRLSVMECEGLGTLIQQSPSLKHLHLILRDLEDPQRLAHGMGHAIHLQVLSIQGLYQSTFSLRQAASDVAVRLLQHPNSQLRKLHLKSIHLKDSQFIKIVEVLPISQLQVLVVDHNDIQSPGIGALADNLSQIKSLKEVELCDNPWERSQEEYCWEDLLQGLRDNFSIEYMRWLSPDRIPFANLFSFYCNLNWAGRRILFTSHPVPAGLWPLILERAGNGTYHVEDWREDYEWRVQKYRVETLFFFLQNCPFLLPIGCSLKDDPKSKKSRCK